MTRYVTTAALVLLTIAALTCATAGSVFAQPPGGGMMSDLMYLERSWTAVCFQLQCSSEQLNALLAPFDEALRTRDAAVQAAIEAQDMEAVTTALSACREVVDAALQEHLTDEQWTKYQELMAYQPLGAGPDRR